MKGEFTGSLKSSLIHFLLTFSLISVINGTPFQFNMFQGNAYSRTEPAGQKNKNWCAYVVHKNVSCTVLGGSESFVQPEVLPCPLQQPNCAQKVIHRTHFRPAYKIAYKTVTELEWRCCPGYQGHACNELKSETPQRQREQGHHLSHTTYPTPSNGVEQQQPVHINHPWMVSPLSSGRQGGGELGRPSGGVVSEGPGGGGSRSTVQHLEEEVHRLSQMVLDMQASMTDTASSLREGLQEEASKMMATFLSDLRPTPTPASARSGKALTVSLQELSAEREYDAHMDEVMNKINQVTDTLESKSNALDDLLGRVGQHDGQLRLLMEAVIQSAPVTPPAPASPDVDLRAYVDAKVHALREELMEGMEIKLADLKNACDYKITCVQEQCEGQETNYLSLAELMDSKESDLRREILDLQAKVIDSSTRESALPTSALARMEDLEARLNASETNAEAQRLFLEVMRKAGAEGVTDLKDVLEDRLTAVEDSVHNLVDLTANSLRTGDVDVLHRDVNSHNNTIQGLGERLDALDQCCSKEDGFSSTDLEKMQLDLQGCRVDIESMQSGLSGLGAVEGRLLDHSSGMEDVRRVLGLLRGHVGALEDSSSDMRRSLGRQSAELQSLNSTCGPAGSALVAGQEARELLELHAAQHQELRSRLGELSGEVKAEGELCREKAEDVAKEVATVAGRVAGVEGVCGKLEPIAGSLQRIREGLNKHIGGLWTCVSQLNGTVRAHGRDIGTLKGTSRTLQGHVSAIARDCSTAAKSGVHAAAGGAKFKPQEVNVEAEAPLLPEPEVMEVGEAGPPGTMTSSKLPKGTDGSMVPVLGFAGAPATPPKSQVSLKLIMPLITDLHTTQKPSLQKPVLTSGQGERVAFSAGLNLLPFPGEVGIIRFNKVLVNDGGHYDSHTGVFTAPTDGRYLVSAVLTAQRGERLEAVLSVSNRSVQKLDTAGFPSGSTAMQRNEQQQCNCGGSASLSLVLKLSRGDKAGLVTTAGKLAISDSSEVLSTFSVVLLYASPSKR